MKILRYTGIRKKTVNGLTHKNRLFYFQNTRSYKWLSFGHQIQNVKLSSIMFASNVLFNVGPLFSSRVAVRTSESRCKATLVAQMSSQALKKGVAVSTLDADVVLVGVRSRSTYQPNWEQKKDDDVPEEVEY